MSCDGHKTAADHVVGRFPDGRRIWRCTSCQTTGTWERGWERFGAIECATCWQEVVTKVECPQCTAERKGKAKATPRRKHALTLARLREIARNMGDE